MVYLFLNFGLTVFLSGTAICFFTGICYLLLFLWPILFQHHDSSILHQLLILQHM